MKPRTEEEKRVVKLSSKLKPLKQEIIDKIDKGYIDKYIFSLKKGENYCQHCGHIWNEKGLKNDTLHTCPHCKKELTVKVTKKQKYYSSTYFSYIDKIQEYQVVRGFYYAIDCDKKIGKPIIRLEEYIQQWINTENAKLTYRRLNPNGCMNYCCDFPYIPNTLSLKRKIENSNLDYYFSNIEIIDKRKVHKTLKRNGFNGEMTLKSVHFFPLLLNNDLETIYKVFGTRAFTLLARESDERIKQYKRILFIIKRNQKYLGDISLLIDYVRLLELFNKDVFNPIYYPKTKKEFNKAHDDLIKKKEKEDEKIRIQIEKEREEEERKERIEQLLKSKKDEEKFIKQKSKFFDIVITNGQIDITVLKSLKDYADEAKYMQHCVFACKYYNKKDSIILSARINGERQETVELSLTTYKVLQSRAKYNKTTIYHDEIIKLVEDNAYLFKQKAFQKKKVA